MSEKTLLTLYFNIITDKKTNFKGVKKNAVYFYTAFFYSVKN